MGLSSFLASPACRNKNGTSDRPCVLKLPPDAGEKQVDYVMCADIFPTGWHATELAGVGPGDAVVIYGSGPVA